MENHRPRTPRDRRAASVALRLLAGAAVSWLAVVVAFQGFLMGLDGTHCETIRIFYARCDALTDWTSRILVLGVVPAAWIIAVSGLCLPPSRAARCWAYGTAGMLAAWPTAHLIAYR
ncbi:hypothetical protein ACX6XY_16275 [Streptomyces sp. O3]